MIGLKNETIYKIQIWIYTYIYTYIYIYTIKKSMHTYIYVYIVVNRYNIIATVHACSFLCESLVWVFCVYFLFHYQYFVYVFIHSKQFTNKWLLKLMRILQNIKILHVTEKITWFYMVFFVSLLVFLYFCGLWFIFLFVQNFT